MLTLVVSPPLSSRYLSNKSHAGFWVQVLSLRQVICRLSATVMEPEAPAHINQLTPATDSIPISVLPKKTSDEPPSPKINVPSELYPSSPNLILMDSACENVVPKAQQARRAEHNLTGKRSFIGMKIGKTAKGKINTPNRSNPKFSLYETTNYDVTSKK